MRPFVSDELWARVEPLLPRAASCAPAGARPGRRDRLVAHRFRQLQCGGEKGGDLTGKNPTDTGKAGSKRHLVVDAQGVPLVVALTPANLHDSQMFTARLDAIPSLTRAGSGRPRRRPDKAPADKGYDYRKCRHACRVRGIRSCIARRGIERPDRLRRHRWVVERAFAWLHQQRRLQIRLDRRAAHYLGFLDLARALICLNSSKGFETLS